VKITDIPNLNEQITKLDYTQKLILLYGIFPNLRHVLG